MPIKRATKNKKLKAPQEARSWEVFLSAIRLRSLEEFQKMRKTLWIVPALLIFATVVAPCVRADTVTFTCTGDNNVENPSPPPFQGPCVEATPIAPDVTFPGPTLEISWYTAANPNPIDITLPSTSNIVDTAVYYWLASNSGFFIFDSLGNGIGYAAADTTLPADAPLPNGTTGLSETGTLTFTSGSVATPEPGTITLMLIGIALVLVMRKRIARGLPRVT
jgi:PEP-CTERM motif